MQTRVVLTVLFFVIGESSAQKGKGDYNLTQIVCNNTTSPLITLDTVLREKDFLRIFGSRLIFLKGIVWINRVKYFTGANCKGDCVDIIAEKRSNVSHIQAVCVESSQLSSSFQIQNQIGTSLSGEICANGSNLANVGVKDVQTLLRADLMQINNPYVINTFEKEGYKFENRLCGQYESNLSVASFNNCAAINNIFCFTPPAPIYTVITVTDFTKRSSILPSTTSFPRSTNSSQSRNRDEAADMTTSGGTSDRSYIAPVVVSLALVGGVAAFLGYILYKRFKQKQNIYWEARSPGNDEEHKYAVPTPYNNTDGPTSVPENSAYYYNDASTDHVQYVNFENKKKERDTIYANNSTDSSENADASSPLEVYESVT